jgi:hypothetical protein
MADNPGSSSQMLAQAIGVNSNLASLNATMRSLFPLNAFRGNFTMTAAASKVVTDANCKAISLVFLQAANAAAGTLQGSSKHLYPTSAAGSFTVTTASGAAAAGTEILNYLIINIG